MGMENFLSKALNYKSWFDKTWRPIELELVKW